MNSTIMPTLRYRDAEAAMVWLCKAFGFTEHLAARDGEGHLVHAELVLGGGMVMLGPIRDSEYDALLTAPSDIGGLETQAPYIVVPDADAHYAIAKAAGAEIVMDITDQDHGGRAYGCRDPEGHYWSIGDFDPWA